VSFIADAAACNELPTPSMTQGSGSTMVWITIERHGSQFFERRWWRSEGWPGRSPTFHSPGRFTLSRWQSVRLLWTTWTSPRIPRARLLETKR
jgi:hypothetical protein